ncbi:MFS transporter [Afipia felis]|jgi:MHS family shikimate/dehydroshikimate transporter-like MFS transporter|uniref:Inner membrane metabolite transport protein yhjE n=2 Tax=Afipia felis TaxID=1035 RepID=A0A380W3K1_AFIFE|nr:MFS transporter [Afipia felis]EKS30746.1 MFS transporter, metabolite:H+ symporter (MHS) family protein [Afipia felis ATCC 53690]SUU75491.1 Inner membrane metabolite transport protein yhjE [Afipia felis]SUU83558.1 Inner membrane metabolite transport protein yhjE [Afipia felis]
MSTAEVLNPAVPKEGSSIKHIVAASVLGTTVEWYDFLIYGTAAALVFNKLFFPNFDPLVGTLAAFGSYAVGFVARPLGGAIFGHFGDKLGRKAMLTLTMIIMGAGTFLIGCLPTYDQVGILAPILLLILRMAQGIGIGGEWGGATLMVIESGDRNRRGFLGSLVQVGFPLGMVCATLIFLLVSKLPDEQFMSWGWRLPFWLSAILVAVGLFVRMRLVETPKFAKVQEQGEISNAPLLDVLTKDFKNFVVAVGLKISEVAWVYVLIGFLVYYATSHLHLSKTVILDAVLYAAILELVTLPLFGLLSDYVGRKPLYIAGTILSMIVAFPLFTLVATKDPTTIAISIAIIMSITHGLMFSPQAAFIPELFGTKVRYSGASLGVQVSAAISGGFAPMIATGLLAYYGTTTPISWYLIALGAITLIATLVSRETAFEDL